MLRIDNLSLTGAVVPGIDYDQTWCGAMRGTSLRVLSNLAANSGMKMRRYDFVAAYWAALSFLLAVPRSQLLVSPDAWCVTFALWRQGGHCVQHVSWLSPRVAAAELQDVVSFDLGFRGFTY
jgi:hypothetical protein